MFTRMICAAVSVASAATLSLLGATGAGASFGATPGGQQPAKAAPKVLAGPGTQLWAKRYNGPGNRDDRATQVVVNPDGGGQVFVTGESPGSGSGYDYATIGYSASTGAWQWRERYNGPGNGDDTAAGLAVSPGGGRVFATGSSLGRSSGADYATVAYRADDGTQLWAQRYNGSGNGTDRAWSVAVSPDGRMVFVTGYSLGRSSGVDYATVAYRTSTGARLWAARYASPGAAADQAFSVAVSPDGHQVFVTGSSDDQMSYTTVSYDAATGAQLWATNYDGPAGGPNVGRSVAVSPDGHTVFVTGYGEGGNTTFVDYATVAYDAATGAQLWAAHYNSRYSDDDFAAALAVSPTGRQVFVTGASLGTNAKSDYATVAYDAATGTQQWAVRYNGPAKDNDAANAVAVNRTGTTVYVTGDSDGTTSVDYTTIGYRAASGAQLWLARYSAVPNTGSTAWSVATSPTSDAVFVTGDSSGTRSYGDYATISYQG